MSSQQIHLKVSPDPSLKIHQETTIPHESLVELKPRIMLGAAREPSLVTTSVQPDAKTCFGPRGVVLLNEQGPLWVCDTGHHRLLGWEKLPSQDLSAADYLIGQPNFKQEGRNGKTDVSSTSLNVPTGVSKCGNGMAVADAWNNRILIWKLIPKRNNVPADIVLGQSDFVSSNANKGSHKASANSFHWPYGVAWANKHLFVADSENRRVLIWKGLPEYNDQPADIVLGQNNFTNRDENAGGTPNAMSMRWPHGIAIWNGHLCVSDAGNNRIMIWKEIPQTSGAECDYVLGQANPNLVDHNQSLYWPRANSLNMPYAIATKDEWLIVADTANSRLLGWHIDDLSNGAPARALLGQNNFHDKGDNRWQPACVDSLCWPYGLQVINNKLAIADSGNNRISLWELAI